MIINHNLSGIFAHRQLNINTIDIQKVQEKLASGLRINRAADDAAGLAISEKMRAQIKGMHQANRNAQDGISFIQTTEGYLQASQDVIQRMRTLAVQSANGIYTSEDRMQIQVEVSQLVDEVDRIASHAQFNTINMLTGRFAATDTAAASMWLHIGANMDQRERLFIGTMTSTGLGLRESGSGEMVKLTTAADANRAIETFDRALRAISKQRADLGAYQNRMEFASKALQIGEENLQASESRIRDADMAEHAVKNTTDMILTQSSIAMLAQANMRPQLILRLLQ